MCLSMTPEGQLPQPTEAKPQLRVLHPFKRRGEGTTRREPQKTNKPSWENNPLLTQEAKERLRAYSERLERVSREDYAAWKAKEPKIPETPVVLVIDGKEYTSMIEAFVAYGVWRERLKPIAKARGVSVDSLLPPEWRPDPITTEPKAQALKTVRSQQTELAREVLTGQFDAIAESIQQKIWKDTSKSNPVSVIKPTGQLDVKIKKDGTVINRSRSGVTISFKQDIRTGSLVRRTEKGEAKHDKLQTVENKIEFGIGYFGKRGDIIPEARGSVTDDEENFKALYIQRTYADVAFISSAYKYMEMKKKTEMYVFPLAYAEHQKEFVEYLYEISKLQSPDQVMKQNPGMPMYLEAA